MRKLRILSSAAALCGGVMALSGCSHQAAVSGGVPMPPPHAAPPAQAQIQDINNNPHIPAAQKALIESHISNGNGVRTDKTPTNAR